jgi:hypothetical protein
VNLHPGGRAAHVRPAALVDQLHHAGHGSAIPPLFAHLFDDAAIFPPGNASMPQAVRRHGEHARAWYAELLGAFVCSADRVTELDAAAQHARSAKVRLALTVPGGPAALPAALATVASYGWLRLSAVELTVRAALPAEGWRQLRLAVPAAAGVWAEIAAGDVDGSLCRQLADAGLGLKLRTGGLNAGSVPHPAELAAALRWAAAAEVPVKCTAGLHHAVCASEPGSGLRWHGFGNVLLAVHLARAGGDLSTVVGALQQDAPGEVAAGLRSMGEPEVDRLRRGFRSIGTCSIDEPLAELVALGLVQPPGGAQLPSAAPAPDTR